MKHLMTTLMLQGRYPAPLVEKFRAYCQATDKTQAKVLIRALVHYLKNEGVIDKNDDSYLDLPKVSQE